MDEYHFVADFRVGQADATRKARLARSDAADSAALNELLVGHRKQRRKRCSVQTADAKAHAGHSFDDDVLEVSTRSCSQAIRFLSSTIAPAPWRMSFSRDFTRL